MRPSKRILPVFALAAAMTAITIGATGCASQSEAEYKANQVTADTGGTVHSVLDSIGDVVMYPFHLIGDLLS